MLIAIRSPAPRSAGFDARSSGICALPAEERLDVALALRLLLDRHHVVADPGVRREVGVDELLGLLARDVRPRREAEVAHPVGQPEVDHLRHRPLAVGDVGRVLVEDPGRGLAVDVGVPGERVLQVLVARDVGEDPELDLGVVRGEQRQVAARRRRTPAGSAARARSGSGCSGGSGPTTRGGRSRRRPGGTSCGAGRRPRRSGSAAPRRRSSGASCRPATRGACRSSGGPAGGPRAPTRRSSSRSSSCGPSAGSARRTGPARAASGCRG